MWWAEVEQVLPARPDISPICYSKYDCYAQISTTNQFPQIRIRTTQDYWSRPSVQIAGRSLVVRPKP